MKIINFLGNKFSHGMAKYIIFISFFAACQVTHGEIYDVTKFKGTNIQIAIHCTDINGMNSCDIMRVESKKNKKILSFPFAPSSIDYDHGIFVITFPCGASCSATYFYNEEDVLGGPFPAVAAYDTEKQAVLSLATNPPKILKMFGKNQVIASIKLNIPRDAENLLDYVVSAKVVEHVFCIDYRDVHGRMVDTRKDIP